MTLTAPSCPVTFDLTRNVKPIQVYFKAKMNKKIYPVLRQGPVIQQEDDGGSDIAPPVPEEGSDEGNDIGNPRLWQMAWV